MIDAVLKLLRIRKPEAPAWIRFGTMFVVQYVYQDHHDEWQWTTEECNTLAEAEAWIKKAKPARYRLVEIPGELAVDDAEAAPDDKAIAEAEAAEAQT